MTISSEKATEQDFVEARSHVQTPCALHFEFELQSASFVQDWPRLHGAQPDVPPQSMPALYANNVITGYEKVQEGTVATQ